MFDWGCFEMFHQNLKLFIHQSSMNIIYSHTVSCNEASVTALTPAYTEETMLRPAGFTYSLFNHLWTNAVFQSAEWAGVQSAVKQTLTPVNRASGSQIPFTVHSRKSDLLLLLLHVNDLLMHLKWAFISHSHLTIDEKHGCVTQKNCEASLQPKSKDDLWLFSLL